VTLLATSIAKHSRVNRISNEPVQPSVLLLKVLEPLRLVDPKSPELLPDFANRDEAAAAAREGRKPTLAEVPLADLSFDPSPPAFPPETPSAKP
jgi:hypothetical protein